MPRRRQAVGEHRLDRPGRADIDDDAIRQDQRLVDAVGDEDDGLAALRVEAQQIPPA